MNNKNSVNVEQNIYFRNFWILMQSAFNTPSPLQQHQLSKNSNNIWPARKWFFHQDILFYYIVLSAAALAISSVPALSLLPLCEKCEQIRQQDVIL